MGHPVPRDAALGLLGRIDRALPFTTIVTHGSPATVWFADVIARVRGGGDPLAPWRDALRLQQERTAGVAVPPHVPAAFVLQWWCEVAATPLAYAVRLGEGVVVPDPGGLGFELAAGLHPHRIVVDPASLVRLAGDGLDVVEVEGAEPVDGVEAVGGADGPDAEDLLLELSRTAYIGLVEEVVREFAPEVKMGTRQRWGVVHDMWDAAVRLADGAAGRVVGPARRRESCCFIYALPNMRECASCPRGGQARRP